MIFTVVALFLFGCSDRDRDEIAKEFNFYFSANETACAFIFYDVEAAPALTIENRIVNYDFDEQNILITSSQLDFGWQSKEASGFKTFNFYNTDGQLITNEDEKPPYFTGGVTVDGVERTYNVIHFNDREECFVDDSFENTEIFFDLVRKIYAKNKEDKKVTEEELLYPDNLVEDKVSEAIHSMSQQKVQSGAQCGHTQITQEKVDRLLAVCKINDYEHNDLYIPILERWSKGDFSNVVDDHNEIWKIHQGGNEDAPGKATRL